MKTKSLRPRRYWAHAAHVREGRIVLCDHARKFPGMIRVLLVPIRPRSLR